MPRLSSPRVLLQRRCMASLVCLRCVASDNAALTARLHLLHYVKIEGVQNIRTLPGQA